MVSGLTHLGEAETLYGRLAAGQRILLDAHRLPAASPRSPTAARVTRRVQVCGPAESGVGQLSEAVSVTVSSVTVEHSRVTGPADTLSP